MGSWGRPIDQNMQSIGLINNGLAKWNFNVIFELFIASDA